MKTLLIVRHAKSSWDHADLDDFDRPLNERGLRNAPEMARRLVLREMLPDLILSSPALRAISTARLFNQQFGRMDEGLKTEKSIYEASRQDLVKLISRQNPDLNIIMLVGHNPGLSDLLNWLCDTEEVLSTCAVAQIEVDDFKWNGWSKGCGKLVELDYPKKPIE
ncbi:MAG: histidine phosphatase family protein [Bacteroidetes bacterium]|nr:histidine phosphatase family protein [Bacteroidota bacterium]